MLANRPTARRLLGGALLLAAAALAVRERQALAAATVGWSDFRLTQGVYFAPAIAADERARLLSDLEQARLRLKSFYGTLHATPTLIVTDAAHLRRFTDGSTAVTHYQPTGPLVIIGPAGRSVDVLAHELAHAELLARLGYFKLQWCIPTWFDEGLAVQFDERPIHGEEAFARRLRSGWRLPPLSELERRSQFFSSDRDITRFHYAGAKRAVAAWLQSLGSTSPLQAIEALGCGASSRRLEDVVLRPWER